MNLLFQALSAHAAANATGEIPGASIVPANPADPQQNTAYSVQFSVTGATGPFTWSRINTIVPAGLSYTNTAGNTYTLAGSTTANVGATFPQTLRATRSDGRFVEAQFDLTIQQSAAGPIAGASITPVSIPNPQQGVAYSVDLNVAGTSGTFTWSITSGFLYSGISLNASTGVISGTTNLGVGTIRTFTVRATRSDGNFVERTIQLTLQSGVAAVSFNMTAADIDSGGRIGYRRIAPSNFGSISQEPFPSNNLVVLAIAPGGVGFQFTFSGDANTFLSGYTELVVDGTSYPITGINFVSSANLSIINVSGTGSLSFVIGTTYACTLQ